RVLMLLEGVGPARARRCLDQLLAGGLLAPAQLPQRWAEARMHLPTVAQEQGDAVAAALAVGADAERLRDALAPVVRAHYVDGAVRIQDLDALCGLGRATRAICGCSWPSCCWIRRPHPQIWPARPCRMKIGSYSPLSTPPRVWNGKPS